jgi:phage terminase large subunit GpA-like protein
MNCQIQELLNDSIVALKPPPRLSVSEWADKYRILSPEASAMPGKWLTGIAEFQRGIMNAVNEPGIDTVVAKTSSQVGKTEIINNIVGFIISQDPSPILVLQPTIEMGQTWSKDRFSPMIRDTSVLNGRIKSPRSKDSNNTILHKIFPGGHITIAGANSAASLASRPIRVVLCDEIDRYPPSAGTEGDPVSLAVKRSTTFWNRVVILVSTPTVKGFSRIDAAWEESDQRRFFVPCPDCGHEQYLVWGNVRWNRDKDGNHLPDTAMYMCEKCGVLWNDAQRLNAVRNGKWIKNNPSIKKVAGFHIWEAYSPWVNMADMVRNFLDSKDSPERLKVFVNTVLGETWEDEGLTVDNIELSTRKEKYKADVPAGGLVLTCGVDVQDDRLEGEIVAFGKGEESWSVDYFIIQGVPDTDLVWNDLDKKLQSTFEHEYKIRLRISATCIDSGGHFTDNVYQFCKGKEGRRIFATKGSNVVGRPIVSRPTKNNKLKVKLFTIGHDTAKELIYARLLKDKPDPGEFSPGYMHFPMKYDDEYFRQLTAEKAVTKYSKGFPHRVWVKIRPRNEVLDCRVGAMAALAILNPNFDKIAESYEKYAREKPAQEDDANKKNKTIVPKRNNWINGWKK